MSDLAEEYKQADKLGKLQIIFSICRQASTTKAEKEILFEAAKKLNFNYKEWFYEQNEFK